MSGALGRGSYHSVIAGTKQWSRPTYYSSSYELIQLHKAHLDVLNHFAVRDKVIDNKFPGCSFANGLFKFVPSRRENYHHRELMEAIRRRSLWMTRIQHQRAINAMIIDRARGSAMSKDFQTKQGVRRSTLKARFSFSTPDVNAYIQPDKHTVANTWPNYWQHPTQKHVIPHPRWKRIPELDNVTRVQESFDGPTMMDY